MALVKVGYNEIDGGWLQGQIETTYDDLVSVFGAPNSDGDGGYKVRAEWVLKDDISGVGATIYDWKEDVPIPAVTDWHIGGASEDAVTVVLNALRETGAI